MNTNENSIFIENLQVQNTHSFNNPLVDTNERIPLDKQEVWIDRSLIPSIPPLPDVFPGGAISGPVRGISGVLLTSLNSSPRQFKYQGTGTQQFANMVPASYFNNAYKPTLRDSKGKVVLYNPNVWVADGLLSIVEFKSDTPVSLGYSPPFTIDYWQYIGPTASSWSSGGNVELENLGTGTQIYNSNTAFGLRSITTGSGLTAEVTPDSEMINFENTLTATNKGNGASIFINKTDNNLNFRSLLSSENNITFVGNSDNIDININTIPLVKLANIPANTIIGNNTLLPSDPKALNAGQVKSLLSLDEVANININTWNGSTFINTLGTINTLNAGTLNVSSTISSTGINSNLILKATGTGIINCESNISSLSLACDTISPIVQSAPKPLILSGLTNGGVEIRDTSLSLKSQLLNSNSDLNIDGLTSTNSRQIVCKQNSDSKCSFGISGSTNFFVKDLSIATPVNLLELTLGGTTTSVLKLPTYTTTGLLRIDNGTVSVDSNISSTSNNLEIKVAIANGNDSNLIIDGVTTTKSRQIVCKQNSASKCSFGISGSTNFFVKDLSIATPVNLLELTLGGTTTSVLKLPTYTINGMMKIRNGIVASDILVSSNDNSLIINNKIANNNDSNLNIDGIITTNSRQIICKQNNTSQCSFGLLGTSNFFVKDLSIATPVNLLELTLGTADGSTLKLPTYTSNGMLKIINGTVSVDTNFTTSTNTINVDNITAITANSNLTLNANGSGAIDCGAFNLKANTILPNTSSGDLTLNAAGTGAINCGAFNLKTNKILASTTDSNLTLNANGNGVISCESTLKVSNIVNNGSITLNANQGTSDVLMVCPLDMSTNDIKNASSITSQTITSKEVVINNTVVNSNSDLNIDGVTTTKSRQIICKQNNALQCSFGLSGSTNFFVKDLSTNPTANLLELTLGTANRASALKLPTYTSNGLLRIDSGTVTVDTNFTTSTNNINCDNITAKTTNSNLTLNGNGTGTVNTNAPYIYIANNRIDTDTSISLDGTTVTKSRYVACYQNAVHTLGFGLAASSYFFIWDNVNARDLFQASIITGNIRFPTYSTNGILRIDSGDVSVDTNFTTSSNTINVDTVRAKTTNSDLFLHPNGTGTVVTNSPVIYIASNRVDTDSRFSIDGPTITNGRYIACFQSGAYKLGFGLQSSTHFFIWDNVNARDLFQANISDGKIRFPTYTNGILRITDGTVAVDSNFTTSTNTINCNNISSNTTTLLLNGVGINANVATNNSAFILRSTVANEDSYVSIGGPTTTNSRFVAYFQNDIHIFSSGLQKTANYFCYDVVNDRTLFALDIGAPNPVRFPTYTTDGSLSVSTFVSGSTSVPGILVRSSDRRLKKNEETLNSADSLQKIMNLQPKKYCWKSDSSNRVKIGFIAQDVESEIPEAIDGKKYEYELVRDGAGPGVDGTVRVDEEGNPVLDYDKPRYRGLDQCAILSTLVSAFQELTNRLNESNSKILNLTNQLAESESKVLELNIRLLNLESKI